MGVSDFLNKGEDKHSIKFLNGFATAGVYDGHFGKFTAELCSDHLQPATISRYQQLRRRLQRFISFLHQNSSKFVGTDDERCLNLLTFLSSEVMNETCMCEAIRVSLKCA